MRFSIPLIAASASLAHSAAVNFPRQTDLGSWNFTRYTTESVPSVGVQTRDVTVLYSGSVTPITCHWSYIPRQGETSSCSDATFSYSLGEKTSNAQLLTVTQTVVIDAASVKITGTGSLTLLCGQGAGFACQGSGKIDATDVVA